MGTYIYSIGVNNMALKTHRTTLQYQLFTRRNASSFPSCLKSSEQVVPQNSFQTFGGPFHMRSIQYVSLFHRCYQHGTQHTQDYTQNAAVNTQKCIFISFSIMFEEQQQTRCYTKALHLWGFFITLVEDDQPRQQRTLQVWS